MKKIRIGEKELRKCQKLNPSFHTESELYLRNEDILKILHSINIGDRRIQTIEALSEIKDDNLVVPKFEIINPSDNSFSGYGMQYYREYINLSKYITEGNLTFEQRNALVSRLCIILKRLEEYGFVYFDVHSDNVLVTSDDMKIIDLDSGFFKDNYFYDYCGIITEGKNLTCDLCFQILLGSNINLDHVDESKKKRLVGGCYNSDQREFVSHALNMNGSYIEPDDYLGCLSEDYIVDARKTLSISSKLH